MLAAYISFGADPGHLLTASVMSATGALAYSKLMLPETEASKTTAEHLVESSSADKEDSSIIDAAARGASAGINIVLNIAANLVAFVSLLYLVNSVVAWLGGLVGLQDFSFEVNGPKWPEPEPADCLPIRRLSTLTSGGTFHAIPWSCPLRPKQRIPFRNVLTRSPMLLFRLQFMLGKLFVPVVWLMGVDPSECDRVATLVGLKTVVNEFVAFQRMGDLKAANLLSVGVRLQIMQRRALMVLTGPILILLLSRGPWPSAPLYCVASRTWAPSPSSSACCPPSRPRPGPPCLTWH